VSEPAAIDDRVAAFEKTVGQLVETMTSQIDIFKKLAAKVSRIEARVCEIGMCEPQGKADVERIVGLECDLMRAELREMSDRIQEIPKRRWFGRGKR
jgi:hypothetical protein